jgi:hypothetical protein
MYLCLKIKNKKERKRTKKNEKERKKNEKRTIYLEMNLNKIFSIIL